MDESDKVYVEGLAWIGWQMLPVPIKGEIVRALEPLAGVSPEQWPTTRVKRWRNEEGMYVLPAWNGDTELFVLFFPKEGRIHIETIASRAKIETLSGRSVAEMIAP